jgi:hypothetical protein
MPAGENAATITVLITIIFSTVVLGWALFYKCTDSTFKTDDLAVEKCFSFIAVPKKEEPTTVVKSNEPVAFFSDSSSKNPVLEKSETDGDDDLDINMLKHISKFKEMGTKLTSDIYSDIRATDLYDCAKICADNEVKIDEDDVSEDQCGGFTSAYKDATPDDGRVMCRLYKKPVYDSEVQSYTTVSFKKK